MTHYHDKIASWLSPSLVSPAQVPVDPLLSNGQVLIDNQIGSLGLPSTQQVFEYDEMGNRLHTREPGLNPFSSVPNHLNQYSTVDDKAWSYDANGNLRKDGKRKFFYDLNNALQEIWQEGTNVREVIYYRDALGRVIAERTTDIRFYICDGTMPLMEISGRSRKEFTAGHRPDVVLHAAVENEDYWLTYDGLTSLRVLTNGSGNIVSMPLFRPFGASEDNELASSPLNLGFVGMRYTTDLPFYLSDHRSYRPDVGRHLQRDPAGFIDGVNLYVYARNNPIDYEDRIGLQSIFSRPFTTPKGPHDVFEQREWVDTGHWSTDLLASTYFGLSNLCAYPFNAVSNILAIPEDTLRFFGAREEDIAALNFALLMTGIGEGRAAFEMLKNTPLAIASARARVSLALNTIRNAKGIVRARAAFSNKIWSKAPIVRGELIELILSKTQYRKWGHIGREHGGTWPLFDFIKGGRAVSLKTIDPTAKTFYDTGLPNLVAHAEDLANRPIRGVVRRTLDVRVPQGTDPNLMKEIAETIKDTVENLEVIVTTF